MSENLGVHAQLTMDGGNFVAETQKAYRALLDYRNEVARLKAEEESLRTVTANLQRQITSKTEKLETEKRKLEELNQSLSKNASLTDAQKTRLEKQTAKVDALEKSLAKANKQFDAARKKQEQNADAQSKITAQTAQATQEIERQTKAYAKNAKQGSDTASQLKSAFLMLKGLALGYAGKTLFSALIGSNADFEQSLTSFDVLLGSAEKAQKMMDELTDFAAVTPLEMPDVTKATNMLLGYGVAAEDVIEVMGRLGDLAQGNAEKLDRVSLAYGQMLAKGKVTGEELRQMVEAQVPLLQGLADYMNVSTAELQKMIEKGAVGIDSLNGAITAMTSEGGKFFGMMEKQSKTMSGMFSTLKDDASIFAREVGEESFNYLKTELENLMATISQMEQDGSLQKLASNIGGGIDITVKSIAGLVEILWDMRGVLATVGVSWAAFRASLGITAVLKAVTGAMGALTATQAASAAATTAGAIATDKNTASLITNSTATAAGTLAKNAWNLVTGQSVLLRNKETGAITIETAAKYASMSATEKATVAQLGLNAAMLASPWFWIPAIIGGVALAVDALTVSYEEQAKKLDEVQGQYEEVSNELESVQSELKETGARIDELNSKESLTITEENELQNLKDTNSELAIRLRYLEKEEEIKRKQVNYETIETAKKRFETGGYSFGEAALAMVGAPFSQDARDNFEGITRNVQDYVIWGERVVEIQKKINAETDPKKLLDYNTELSSYKAKIAEASGELQKWANNITESDSASQQMKQNLQNDIEYMNQFLYTAQELNKIEFDKVFNAEDFASAKARLLELAEAGEVTSAVIESYKEFNELMAETGLTAQQIADEINGSVQKQKDNTVQAFSDLTAKFSDAVSALELLDAAYKKVSQGQSLTAQEVVNLVSTYPELETAVIKTADGFLIEKDALEKVAGSSDNLKINHIQAQIEMTRNLLEQSSERLSALNVELDGIKSLADAYAQLAGGNGKYYGMTYREYRTRGISGDDGPKMTEAEFNQMQLEMGKDVKNVLAYGAALDKLSSAQERLKNITIPMGGSSKSGGSKSSGSKKDPQKEYEENVKKYKAAVEDIIQTDEEWNEHEKKMGRLSDGDFYGNMARRADALREEADKVLNVEWMTYQDRQKLRAEFLKEAELIEYDYKEGYVGMADEIVEAEKDALEERFDASEKYIEDCNRENKWGEDNEIAALERILAYHLENFDDRKKIIEGYYADGTYTREQFEKRMDELDDEREEKTRDLGARIYDKAKEQGEEYYKEVSERIKEQYGKELEFEKEKWEAIAEYRSNAMLQEIERLENQLKKQTAKIDAQLEELADALEAFDRRMEDEHDDRKLKRLQYNLEYESDEDNRRSLEKEIEKLEEEIAEKKFKRDIADQQEALNEKKDRINEEMQYEIDAAKKAGDEMVASAKTRIDRINEYYNNKMSAANIANELVSGLAANGEKFEYAGEVMGELMATGISKTLDGYLNGIYSSIGNLGVKMNRGAASHEMVHRVVNNNQSYTTNITTTKPVSPAEARKYAKKWQKINELESGV